MARIASVKVWGFRSHISSLFPLSSDGLTVITGKNDAGKSAFIQAIKWVAFGEPSGEDFLFTIVDEQTQEIIEQAEEAGVEITLDDGVVITKIRKKGKTMYRLSTLPDPFEKAEVPIEVIHALGLTKQTFGDFETDINFAYQLAGPWILSEPASTGAKVLGKIAGTEVVDLAIRAVAKDTYKAREEKSQAEKDAGQRSIELLEYQDLETLKMQLDACEFLLEELQTSLKRKDKLQNLFLAYNDVTINLDALAVKLDELSVLPEIAKDLQDAEKAQQRYDKLLDLYGQYGKATATVDKLTELLARYQGLDLVAGFLQLAEQSNQRYTILCNLLALYQKTTRDVNSAQEILEKTKDLDLAQSFIELAEKCLSRITRLQILNNRYKTASIQIDRYQTVLDGIAGLGVVAKLIAQAEVSQKRILKLRELLTKYNVKAQTARRAEDTKRDTERQLILAQNELAEAWEAVGGICPLCEQPLTGGKHHGH